MSNLIITFVMDHQFTYAGWLPIGFPVDGVLCTADKDLAQSVIANPDRFAVDMTSHSSKFSNYIGVGTFYIKLMSSDLRTTDVLTFDAVHYDANSGFRADNKDYSVGTYLAAPLLYHGPIEWAVVKATAPYVNPDLYAPLKPGQSPVPYGISYSIRDNARPYLLYRRYRLFDGRLTDPARVLCASVRLAFPEITVRSLSAESSEVKIMQLKMHPSLSPGSAISRRYSPPNYGFLTADKRATSGYENYIQVRSGASHPYPWLAGDYNIFDSPVEILEVSADLLSEADQIADHIDIFIKDERVYRFPFDSLSVSAFFQRDAAYALAHLTEEWVAAQDYSSTSKTELNGGGEQVVVSGLSMAGLSIDFSQLTNSQAANLTSLLQTLTHLCQSQIENLQSLSQSVLAIGSSPSFAHLSELANLPQLNSLSTIGAALSAMKSDTYELTNLRVLVTYLGELSASMAEINRSFKTFIASNVEGSSVSSSPSASARSTVSIRDAVSAVGRTPSTRS